MRQTSSPEKTPSLGTGYFEVSEECRALEPSLNLGWTRSLEEAFDRFLEIVQSLVYRLALTRDVKFRAESDIPGILGV
jgi:hypothetical protein